MPSQVLWGVSVPMRTAILGQLSQDAIAANSVATTFCQYLNNLTPGGNGNGFESDRYHGICYGRDALPDAR